MNTKIPSTLNLQVGQVVYYLGDFSSIIGHKNNPTSGWGEIIRVEKGDDFRPLKYVIDMGPDYVCQFNRYITVAYYSFGYGSHQIFKTVEQMMADRDEKNDELNKFYNSFNRTVFSDSLES